MMEIQLFWLSISLHPGCSSVAVPCATRSMFTVKGKQIEWPFEVSQNHAGSGGDMPWSY